MGTGKGKIYVAIHQVHSLYIIYLVTLKVALPGATAIYKKNKRV